ncbi:MAG: cbb3-type cytochrome oxidase assembly protein CcoS [Gemmataceae bacterium]|nr:cbb3-type cytochrome oxidase assembly protein CcoS [Gemmataceae bacterium]
MSPADFAVLLTIVGSVVVFGGAAVLALGWAVRDGQFLNLGRGARTIFDADEPVGEPTDDVLGRGPGR